MTATTVGPKFSIMNVVRAVTVDAACADLLHLFQRASMTAFTGNIYVATLQQEVCLDIVVKEPEVPRDRVMAGGAVIGEDAVVIVIFQVAGDTVFLGVNVDLGFVTIFAFHVVVFAQQRKFRQVMIEIGCILPSAFVMTIGALFSLRTFVHVVVNMA